MPERASCFGVIELRFALLGRILMKTLAAFAGCLFLASIAYPFANAHITPRYDIEGRYDGVMGELWSFKETLESYDFSTVTFKTSVRTQEYWFGDFWGLTDPRDDMALLSKRQGYGITVLVCVFIPQILTLGFAALSFLAQKKFWPWLLAVTASSLSTTLGMQLFSPDRAINPETGFWLALASAILFSTIFIASVAWTWKNRLARLGRRLLHR